jgi:hypothetical protein
MELQHGNDDTPLLFTSLKRRQPCVGYTKLEKTKPSRWWSSNKSLEPRGLLPLWSQVRVLWLLIWWPLEAYMVVNFRTRGISRGARKLARTPTLNLKKKKTWKTMLKWLLPWKYEAQVLQSYLRWDCFSFKFEYVNVRCKTLNFCWFL